MNRIAWITGGARGIGLGIARSLSAESFDLVLSGRSEPDRVESILASLRETGARVLYLQADVADAAQRTRALDRVKEAFGALHVLVNNAGVAPEVRADLTEMTEASYERVMKINLQGPFFLTQAAANWMIRQKQADPAYRGCIINISSISATVASINRGEYCISKAGLSMATQLWAARLGEYDLPVYEIRPGVTRSDMTAGVREKYDRMIADGLCVQRRWGEPEDVGRACALLARGELAYSTGQVLHVDGGLTLARL